MANRIQLFIIRAFFHGSLVIKTLPGKKIKFLQIKVGLRDVGFRLLLWKQKYNTRILPPAPLSWHSKLFLNDFAAPQAAS